MWYLTYQRLRDLGSIQFKFKACLPAMKSVEGTQPIRKHSLIPIQHMVEQKKPTQQQRKVVAYYVSFFIGFGDII